MSQLLSIAEAILAVIGGLTCLFLGWGLVEVLLMYWCDWRHTKAKSARHWENEV